MTSVGDTSNEGTSDLRSFSAQTLRRGGDAFRSLLQSETLGSIVLLLAVVVALVWANIAPAGYDGTWESVFGLRLRTHEVDHTLREWVNSGLMTVFFVVVGLEARREFDLGELRERSRLAMPVAVGILAMAIPVGIFIAANVSSGNAGAWGVAMSSDTALALGALSVLRGSNGDRLRIHLVTILVVDDLVSIIVVATVYSSSVSWVRVGIAVGVLAILVLAVRFGMRQLVPFVVLGFVAWAALFGSGIDPIAAGLAIGLAAPAFTPRRESLERATSTFRAFREEPTPELARTATAAVSDTQSMNARLQRIFVPWSAFLIVPLFALANAGVRLDGDSLRAAATSPITWGIIAALLLGKPLAHILATRVVTRASTGSLLAPVGPGGIVIGGLAAAAPFTLALLIANTALSGSTLTEAKIGILAAAVLSFAITSLVLVLVGRLSRARQARLLIGAASGLTDLQQPVDPRRDHIRGAADSDVTVVEYGDFECPHCGLAETAAQREQAEDKRIRYVWRHFPLTDVHPRAQIAAEASEAAAIQGAFWEMHDILLTHQDDLTRDDLIGYARDLGLDVDRFTAEIESRTHRQRIAQDVDSAECSGVAGTPTFFINERRHYGAYDFESIREAVKQARDRLLVAAGRSDVA